MNRPLAEIAIRAVHLALELGATDAECYAAGGDEFSVRVRMREIETIKEAGSRGASLRVFRGKRSGAAYTSDLSDEGLARMAANALELSTVTTEDPDAGLPAEDELGSAAGDLALYHEDVVRLEVGFKIAQAKEAEEAALTYDPRIANSEGSSFESHVGQRAFANSHGFAGAYRASRCSLGVMPVAREDGSMERDYWITVARTAAGLERPNDVGRLAAERAVRRLHARKIETQKVPVVFEPRVARTLLGHLFEAVSGESVYRRASYLAGKLGETIAAAPVTVIDDGTVPGLFGSAPFDGEGVPTRRTVVVERGRLASFLLNSYTARKLGEKTTGNATRSMSGGAGVGHGNFYLEPGEISPGEIVRSVRQGLFVTEVMGFGVNIVTGDYSRGAAGFWIENGELAYPVSEVTIAGSLMRMLQQIDAIGDDLEFRGSIASPTLLIGEMTVSGR
jgi:PmbA protein